MIELLIVVAIMGIMGILSVVALQNLMPRIRLDNTVQASDLLIKRVRLVAIRRQIGIELRVEDAAGAQTNVAALTDGNEYRLVARNTGDPDPNSNFIGAAPLPIPGENPISLGEISFPGESVLLTRLGEVATTGSIFFHLPNGSNTHRKVREIRIVNTAGRTELRSYEEEIP